jgi:rubrerythrin
MPIFQANDVVEMALELEKSGEAFYRRVAAKAQTPETQALFVSLADAEVEHYAAFKKLSETVWDQPLMLPDEWGQYLAYLQATIQSVFFEGEDKALALAEEVSDEKEALRMAMGFEKETLLFFYDLRDMVSEGDKAVLMRIVSEEKAHLRLLADTLKSLEAAPSMDWNSPLGVIRRAMQIERDGYRFYTDAAERSVSESGRKVFEGLAADEVNHLHLLLVEYDALASGQGWVDPTKALERQMEFDHADPDLPGEDYPEPMPIFSPARVPSLDNDLAALEFAMETEQMSYDLYKASAGEQSDSAAREAYEILAREENKHYELLQSSRDYLTDNGTWWDTDEMPFFEG